MVRWLSLAAALLLAFVIASSDAQTLTSTADWRPNGTLFPRADGSYGYVVSDEDNVGQWQVAFGDPKLWLMLVQANPQLTDPNLVKPGQTLNVPFPLVKLFRIIAEVDAAGGPMPAKGAGPVVGASTPLPPVAHTADGNRMLWAILLTVIGTLAVVGAALWYLRHWNRMRSPYSGPPVREGGLPTADAAVAHFTDRYRTERGNLTVATDQTLPPRVSIEQIRAVDVRGPMQVKFADGPGPRNFPQWTPAWECRLSDATLLYTLTACGNDVYTGRGMSALPETQIRARQDVPVMTPQRQIWPTVEETPAPAAAPVEPEPVLVIPDQVANYTSVKITGPSRYVLHTPDGRDLVVDVGVLGDVLTLGIDHDRIYAVVGPNRRVFGRLAQADRPTTETTTEPTTESADGRSPQPAAS
ncbi:MAG: hypothetical protein HY340_00920 [Candidatus Kerfeldbacteria bacterium]|nr:hypothetical protein [Candidatus Kerfeldbacteria bacterium]